MKKLLTLTTGILLSGVLLSQIPLKVYKTLEIKNGDTTEINDVVNVINIKAKYGNNMHVKVFPETREREIDLVVKHKPFKMDVTEYTAHTNWDVEYKGYIDNVGNVEIRHDWLHGYIKFDYDKDGVFDKIILLKIDDGEEVNTYLFSKI